MEKNNEQKSEKELETVTVAAVETPDAPADTGTEVARPSVGQSVPDGSPVDTPPADGEGCESVTVIVAETQARHPKRALLAARSVRQNLIGADALVLIMGYNEQMSMAQSLLRMLEVVGTERVVLMTDEMVLLNPTTLYELGCRRGELTEKGVTVGECRTPKLMHKSVLLKMLPEMIATYALFNPLLEYDEYARPQVMPVIMRPWNQDNWLLPIVTDNPPVEALHKWAKTQRFLFVSRPEWPRSVVKFLEERFPA